MSLWEEKAGKIFYKMIRKPLLLSLATSNMKTSGHLGSLFGDLSLIVEDLHLVKLLSVLQDFCLQTIQNALESQTLLLRLRNQDQNQNQT